MWPDPPRPLHSSALSLCPERPCDKVEDKHTAALLSDVFLALRPSANTLSLPGALWALLFRPVLLKVMSKTTLGALHGSFHWPRNGCMMVPQWFAVLLCFWLEPTSGFMWKPRVDSDCKMMLFYTLGRTIEGAEGRPDSAGAQCDSSGQGKAPGCLKHLDNCGSGSHSPLPQSPPLLALTAALTSK